MILIELFAIFMVLMFLEMPIAFAMGIPAALVLIHYQVVPLILIPQRLFVTINSFPLMAVPFFIVAGYLMNACGVTRRLVNLARGLVGHWRGGLAHVSVVAGMFFAGVSGSASAEAAALGSIMIPAMEKDGYENSFSAGLVAATATLGPIIPPSLLMVIYGAIADVSVGKLFLAGAIPGVLIGFSLMGISAIYAGRRNYPRGERVPWRQRLRLFKEASLALMAPVIILGGILGGIFTATEAGAVVAVYTLILGLFVYKEVRLRDLPRIFIEAGNMTAIPMFILGMASIFGWVLARERFAIYLTNLFLSISSDPLVVYLLIVAMLFLVGMFVEGLAAMMIFVPVLHPLGLSMGYDPIHFALIVVVVILIGTVTPPVGLQLYITCAIAKISVPKATIWPFVFAETATTLLVLYFPPLALFLPYLFFSK
jgi:tripartite ATP-independent transporter DctM subunit